MAVIKAHITGTVWKIEVKVGDTIEEGTVVAILESMKMEMPVESEFKGKVTKIHVTESQPVNEDDPIADVELPRGGAPGAPRRGRAHSARSTD